jgi:hypothetical protein
MKRGHGREGQVPHQKGTEEYAKSFSVLPAMTVDGYIACDLYHGDVDDERFINFIQHNVIPLCTPFPGPRSVIVMDNASIHRGEVWLSSLM